MAERAEGGHFSSNVQDEGVLHSEHRSTAAERCCEWGVIVDEGGEEAPEVVLVEAPKGQTLEEWQEDMAELRQRAREAINEHEA